jgi:hypothetical protein
MNYLLALLFITASANAGIFGDTSNPDNTSITGRPKMYLFHPEKRREAEERRRQQREGTQQNQGNRRMNRRQQRQQNRQQHQANKADRA